MPQCITIDNREYLLVFAGPNTKPAWLVTPTDAPTGAVATIRQHDNGEFYIETMEEFFVSGFETAVQARTHIDQAHIPDATVLPHHDGSYRVNIKQSQIHGFGSEMQALQRLHEIVTPQTG